MQKSRIIGIDPASRDGDECAVCVAERDDEGNTNIIFAQRHLPTYTVKITEQKKETKCQE